MLFNSIEFVLYFAVVVILYWGIFNHLSVRLRNLFILATSYFFYACWDYRFLSLIVLSSLVDFLCGKYIHKTKTLRLKRLFLFISLSVNLGILFFFKYYGFFAHELANLLDKLGYSLHQTDLNIILPVGISFYTFQTLSYTIDIYRKKLKPTEDALTFFSFVSFFPQLVAGPIERAKHLLPQFNTLKKFDYSNAANGFRQLLWGFFAKIAVADSVSPIVDTIFAQHESLNAGTLLFGAILFSIQIFGDFSGYSNIAIGTASILGFDLMQNFKIPYFSRNIKEFWSRWHISLSTWFRDYVYIPMGGNRCSKSKHILNIMITFTVSGLWHGANWTFLIWGVIHGLFYLLSLPFSNKEKSTQLQLKQWPAMLTTFLIVTFAFVIFRSTDIGQAWNFLTRIVLMKKGLNIFQLVSLSKIIPAILFSITLFVCEWHFRNKRHGLDIVLHKLIVRRAIYYLIVFSILFSFQSNRIFIYFQF